jgi:multisubunit Na+/H+ antiporter MnhC subunit
MISIILRTATRFLLALLLLFSVFLLLRGHNELGGGFVGGLVAAVAYILYAIAYDVPSTRSALRLAPDAEQLTPPFADPVPQAFILTAIVIGFGVLAFTLVLAYRAFQVVGSDDLDAMINTDTLPPDLPLLPEQTADSDRVQKSEAGQQPVVVREGTADESR